MIKVILVTLLLISSQSFAQQSCQSLFKLGVVDTSGPQYQRMIQELYELREQALNEKQGHYLILNSLFKKKHRELLDVVSEAQIREDLAKISKLDPKPQTKKSPELQTEVRKLFEPPKKVDELGFPAILLRDISLKISSDLKTIVYKDDHNLEIFDVKSRTSKTVDLEKPIYYLRLMDNESKVLLLGHDWIKTYDLKNEKVETVFDDKKTDFVSNKFDASQDGRYILLIDKNELRILDLKTKEDKSIKLRTESIQFYFSGDSQVIYGFLANTIVVYDLNLKKINSYKLPKDIKEEFWVDYTPIDNTRDLIGRSKSQFYVLKFNSKDLDLSTFNGDQGVTGPVIHSSDGKFFLVQDVMKGDRAGIVSYLNNQPHFQYAFHIPRYIFEAQFSKDQKEIMFINRSDDVIELWSWE